MEFLRDSIYDGPEIEPANPESGSSKKDLLVGGACAALSTAFRFQEEILAKYIQTCESLSELNALDLLICGRCRSGFHVVSEFKAHRALCGVSGVSGVSDGNGVVSSKEESCTSLAFLLWTTTIQRIMSESYSISWPDNEMTIKIYDGWWNLRPDTKSIWINAAQKMLDLSNLGRLFFIDKSSIKRRSNNKFMLVLGEKIDREDKEFSISKNEEIISKNLKVHLSHLSPNLNDIDASNFSIDTTKYTQTDFYDDTNFVPQNCLHPIYSIKERIITEEDNNLVGLRSKLDGISKDNLPIYKKQLSVYMNDQGTQTLTVIGDVKSTQVGGFDYAKYDHLNLCGCQHSENLIQFDDRDNTSLKNYNMGKDNSNCSQFLVSNNFDIVKEQLSRGWLIPKVILNRITDGVIKNIKARNSLEYKKLKMFEPNSRVQIESVYFASVNAKKKSFVEDCQMNNVYSLETKKRRTYNCYERISNNLFLDKVNNTSSFCFESSSILKNNTVELGRNRCTTTLLNAVEDGLLGYEVQSEFMSYNILGQCNKNLFSSYEEYYSGQKSLPPISKSKSEISDKKLPPGLSILPFKILPSYEVDKSEKHLTGQFQNNPNFPNGLKAFIPNGYSLIKTSTTNGKLHYCFRKKKEFCHLSSKEEKRMIKKVKNCLNFNMSNDAMTSNSEMTEEFILDHNTGVLINKDGFPLQLPIVPIEKSSIVQLECEQSIDPVLPVTLCGENQQIISQFDESTTLTTDRNAFPNSRAMVRSEQVGGSFKALLVLPGGQMVLTSLSNEQFDRMDVSVVSSNGTCYEEISSENTIVHLPPPESYPLACVSGLIQKSDDVEVQYYSQLSPGGLFQTIPSTVSMSRSQDLSSTNNISATKVQNLNAPSFSRPLQIMKTEKQTLSNN